MFRDEWVVQQDFLFILQRHATMLQSADSSGDDPIAKSSSGLDTPRDMLTAILRAGAQKMLASAIGQEVACYLKTR